MKQYLPIITPFIAAFLTLLITRYHEISKRCNKEEVIKQILIKILEGLALNMSQMHKQLLNIRKEHKMELYSEALFLYIRKDILSSINKEDLNSFIVKYLNSEINYFIEFDRLIEYLETNGVREAIRKRNSGSNTKEEIKIYKDYITYTCEDINKCFNETADLILKIKKLPKLDTDYMKFLKSIYLK